MHRMGRMVLLSLVLAASATAADSPKRAGFHVKNTFTVKVPKGAQRVRVWFALPQEDAWSTIRNLNLTSDAAQARCMAAVAELLQPGGRFVVEAFVPDEPPRRGDSVSVKSLAADRVVLSLSVHDPDRQSASGQFVELTEGGGVRLRPWSIHYATPEQLDAHAATVGLVLEHRWEAFDRTPFDAGSARHVSVYRRPELPIKDALASAEDLS